jgi:hypothetical protein
MSRDRDERFDYELSKSEFVAFISDSNRTDQDEGDRDCSRRTFAEPINPIPMSEPAWFCEIPASVRPGDSSARRLEELRRRTQIPQRVFASMVLQSPGITKILVERQFEDHRRRRPDATNTELFKSILHFRYFTTDIADGMAPDDAREHLQQPWRQSIIRSVVEEISTIDDLVHYIADEYEEFWKHTSDPLGVNSQIAEILGYQRQA